MVFVCRYFVPCVCIPYLDGFISTTRGNVFAIWCPHHCLNTIRMMPIGAERRSRRGFWRERNDNPLHTSGGLRLGNGGVLWSLPYAQQFLLYTVHRSRSFQRVHFYHLHN